MPPSDVYGMIASVRIGPVPGPPVIFAFVDRVRLLQQRDSPAAVPPYRLFSFHSRISLEDESFKRDDVPSVRTKAGIPVWQSRRMGSD
jgi:hypothetical protein